MAKKIDKNLAQAPPATPTARIRIFFWKVGITVLFPLIDNMRGAHVAVLTIMAAIALGALLALVWMAVAIASAPHLIADFIGKTQAV